MSTFPGPINEIKNVTIDRFDGENLQSTCYFLSHCHTDHMQGLDNADFLNHLEKGKYKIYCSELTKILLIDFDRYTCLQNYVCSLPVDSPQSVFVPGGDGQEECITVTLIPAGHCLGSTMFLFETDKVRVLYTGDYRLPPGGAARIKHLHSHDRVKHIDALYIDTTFCVPRAQYIASREESAEAVLKFVGDWIYKSPRHQVKLITRASYSYEHLYEILHDKFNMKVHVSDRFYPSYQKIPSLSHHMTDQPHSTQIHACGEFSSCPALRQPDSIVRILQPSTLWFTQSERHLKNIVAVTENKIRICYCFHPSYTELKELVGYLKPGRVYPNVKPPQAELGDSDHSEFISE